MAERGRRNVAIAKRTLKTAQVHGLLAGQSPGACMRLRGRYTNSFVGVYSLCGQLKLGQALANPTRLVSFAGGNLFRRSSVRNPLTNTTCQSSHAIPY
jgi:hypothetical protein